MARISRVFAGGDEPAGDIAARTRVHYETAMQRAGQLARHAGQTPNDIARAWLIRLAHEERQQAERLRRKIMELGSFAGEVPKASEPAGAQNHWGRLVNDLQAHRQAVRACLDESARLSDDQPELAEFFRRLAGEEEIHAEGIRGLIARADPQALD